MTITKYVYDVLVINKNTDDIIFRDVFVSKNYDDSGSPIEPLVYMKNQLKCSYARMIEGMTVADVFFVCTLTGTYTKYI